LTHAGSADGELDRTVIEFYDRHPYPPPATDLDRHADAWRDPIRRRVEQHRIWPTVPLRERSILVAGCGTSQAARYAITHPDALVVGIDVSTEGLRHHETLRARYRLDNLELREVPIEQVATLGSTFEHIVCTGVLHHLDDPDVGLAALRSVLAPAGAIVLMVYAPYGRTGIYMFQDYCRRLGVGSSPDEIADLVATLREIPLAHPLSHLLRSTPDFRNDDALADALLHPRDRAYAVPELFDWLQRCGLTFGRWIRQAPYDPRCGAPSTTPHRARMQRLEPVERFAAMELFRGTMTRHSVIAYRDDAARDPQPIRFTDDTWRRYVPVLEPTVVTVDERLPPGAAAAVLNTAHEHTDIVLFVDQHERSVLDAIDGRRSAADLCTEAPDFLERLWRHDLVVFDATDVGGRVP
jgi:SAM-dependent methyltransferase